MKRYARKLKRPTKRFIRRPKKTNKRLIKTIQKVINKNAEDKEAYKLIVNTNYNSGIDSQADLSSIIPSITNGTGDSGRVGDQIMAKSLRITGYILSNLTYTTYSDCRIGVRLMVVSPKSYVGYDAAYNSATTWLAYLLKKGSTTSGFTGTVNDFLAPINSDGITKHYDKRFYVKAPFIPGTSTGDVSTIGSTKFFNISIRLKNKILKYDSANNSGLTPTHYNPFLIVGYCHLDSATPDTVNTQINLNFQSILKYQDS